MEKLEEKLTLKDKAKIYMLNEFYSKKECEKITKMFYDEKNISKWLDRIRIPLGDFLLINESTLKDEEGIVFISDGFKLYMVDWGYTLPSDITKYVFRCLSLKYWEEFYRAPLVEMDLRTYNLELKENMKEERDGLYYTSIMIGFRKLNIYVKAKDKEKTMQKLGKNDVICYYDGDDFKYIDLEPHPEDTVLVV